MPWKRLFELLKLVLFQVSDFLGCQLTYVDIDCLGSSIPAAWVKPCPHCPEVATEGGDFAVEAAIQQECHRPKCRKATIDMSKTVEASEWMKCLGDPSDAINRPD